MTEPHDLHFMHGHSMPTRDHATLLACLSREATAVVSSA
jgi:hypothetical protein